MSEYLETAFTGPGLTEVFEARSDTGALVNVHVALSDAGSSTGLYTLMRYHPFGWRRHSSRFPQLSCEGIDAVTFELPVGYYALHTDDETGAVAVSVAGDVRLDVSEEKRILTGTGTKLGPPPFGSWPSES